MTEEQFYTANIENSQKYTAALDKIRLEYETQPEELLTEEIIQNQYKSMINNANEVINNFSTYVKISNRQ